MKKLMTMALALVMVVTMTGVGYAADPTNINSISGTAQKDVKITVTPAESSEVVSVDITWDDLSFSYTGASETWDPSDHTNKFSGGSGSWSPVNKTIKVTNHSNIAVTATGTLGNGTTTGAVTDGVKATIASNTFELATAVDTLYSKAPNNSMTVSVDGTPTAKKSNVTLDTVTITISK